MIGERVLSTRWRKWGAAAVIWRPRLRGCWGCAAWDDPVGRSTCRRGCRWRYSGILSGHTRIWSVAWEMTATCTRVRTLRTDIAARRHRQSKRTPSRGWLQAYREACLHHTPVPAERTRDEPHPRDLSRVSLPYRQAAKHTLRSKHRGLARAFLSFFFFPIVRRRKSSNQAYRRYWIKLAPKKDCAKSSAIEIDPGRV